MHKRIPLYIPYFDKDDEEAVAERVRSAWAVGDGPKCREFEQAFAEYLGVKYALLTTSCTAALHLAFMSLGLQEGEAIVPDFTFTSTALAPMLSGLQVKLCDVEYETANIDTSLIERCITKKTKAIVPVDYAGHPCKIDRVNEIAKKHGLLVIQDSAQSCGSKFKGSLIGTLAKITCFSFHATKNLVTGEGGCMVTDDDTIAKRAYIIREKGTNKHKFITEEKKKGYFEYQMIGNSYVQSDILGALALSQLKKLDWMNERRREHAEYLNKGLAGIEGIELPYVGKDVKTNWHIYAIRVLDGHLRDFMGRLNNEGVECNTHYNPLHINKLYRKLGYREDDFPNSNRVFQTLLRLPMYPQLTHDKLDRIIASVKKVAERIF